MILSKMLKLDLCLFKQESGNNRFLKLPSGDVVHTTNLKNFSAVIFCVVLNRRWNGASCADPDFVVLCHVLEDAFPYIRVF